MLGFLEEIRTLVSADSHTPDRHGRMGMVAAGEFLDCSLSWGVGYDKLEKPPHAVRAESVMRQGQTVGYLQNGIGMISSRCSGVTCTGRCGR